MVHDREPSAAAGGPRTRATEPEGARAGPRGTDAVDDSAPQPGAVRRFRLTVVEGREPGRRWDSSSDGCSLGSHPSNDLVLDDPTASRFHCEIRMTPRGPRVRDLGSRNGTVLDGVTVADAFLRSGSLLRLGRVAVRFDVLPDSSRLPLSDRTRFGPLVGASAAMRTCFALLERAAASDATVLIEGETGTGKTAAARAIHEASARAGGPFVVVEGAGLPPGLLESELFGHEPGAFTDARARRLGAFEEASGGTLFIDDVAEMPLPLQPKLLRALESREIRRLGRTAPIPVDVRVMAATNRDLRAEVNGGRFRPDLFYRLAVFRVTLPPLRERPEDIPLVVARLLEDLEAGPGGAALLDPAYLAALRGAAWPGNVRELRNHLERCLALEDALPPSEAADLAPGGPVDAGLPYAEARRRALDEFERRYLQALLEAHRRRVTPAAAAAGIDRVYLYRLLRRHGLKP